MTDPNASAQPIHGAYDNKGQCIDDPRNKILQGGLTKRETFAAMAMQGYISAGSTGMPDEKTIATMSVNAANALIKALNKEEQ